MRRIVLWFASTVSVLVLLFGYHTSTSGPSNAATETAIVSVRGAGNAGGSASSSAPSPGRSRAGGSAGSQPGSNDTTPARRTVTGAVAATQWGPVQVQLTVSGDTITRVAVVQYPNGNPQDYAINSQALPILIHETTTSQSANIDMVSGATITSTGYLQSLQSALDQAGL
jgi:uncharacterized protein with FMN-binding domain